MNSIKRIINGSLVSLICVFVVGAMFFLRTICTTKQAVATQSLTAGSFDMSTFPPNNITGWNPNECTAGSGNLSVCGTALPSETIEMLESAGVKEKAEENMERYKYAEDQTGLPWQIVAALHYREAGMGSGQSISNGQPLSSGGCYTNVDGVQICSDANEDAVQAAHHFIDMGQSVYGVDVLNDASQESYGKAFLAYNRGYMYKCNGDRPYTDSPYVMNYFDENHMGMSFLSGADDTDCNGNVLNNVGGLKDARPGALAVLAYLCGDSSTASTASSGGSSSSSSSSEDGSNVTIIGDSITVAATDAIKAKLPNADIHAQNCKTVGYDFDNGCGGVVGVNKSGLTLVKELKASGALRDKVVLALGTNTAGSDKLQQVIDEIGDERQIYLMTLYETSNDHASQNTTINQLAADNSHINVFDWANAARSNPSMLSDGTHPNSEGQTIFADLIYEAVSASGCTTYEGDYPEYLQGSEPWGPMSYGPGCTFAGCACGATSMAMLTTYVTGQDVLPTDVADLLGSDYYWATGGEGATNLDKRVCEKYGCTAETVAWSGYDDAISKMSQYLKEGYSIHLSGAGSYPFSSGGHYIGIFGPTSGDKVMVANSAFGGNAEMSLSEVVHAGMHYNFTIIKGSGSSASCDAICDAAPEVALDGGLSVEEAQKIADYYNSDAVSSAGLPMGTKENCVSFSAWFVSYLTNVTDSVNPTRGDGLDVAGNLIADFSLNGGETPQVWSVFSNPSGTLVNGSSNHTGVIVGIEDGQAITIEAAWGGWSGSSNGLARVWKYAMPESGMLYAYLSDHLETDKISQIVGGN